LEATTLFEPKFRFTDVYTSSMNHNLPLVVIDQRLNFIMHQTESAKLILVAVERAIEVRILFHGSV
jgi:hypothetical protein